MRLPTRSEIEEIAVQLPKPRVIYDISGKSKYLSRYYLFGRPTMPDGSEPFDEFGDPHEDAVWDKSFGVYLHCFHRGDEDRELHNHPWAWSLSLILVGGYREERRIKRWVWDCYEDVVETRVFEPGLTNQIGKDDFHRVELLDGECWTLFMAGPKVDTWGFWDRKSGEDIHWREFVARKRGVVSSSKGRIGK